VTELVAEPAATGFDATAAGLATEVGRVANSSRNETSDSGSFFDAFGTSAATGAVFADDEVVFAAVVEPDFAPDTLDEELAVLEPEDVADETVELTFEPALSRSRFTLSVTELTWDLTPVNSP
jgi:hypothetical protein